MYIQTITKHYPISSALFNIQSIYQSLIPYPTYHPIYKPLSIFLITLSSIQCIIHYSKHYPVLSNNVQLNTHSTNFPEALEVHYTLSPFHNPVPIHCSIESSPLPSSLIHDPLSNIHHLLSSTFNITFNSVHYTIFKGASTIKSKSRYYQLSPYPLLQATVGRKILPPETISYLTSHLGLKTNYPGLQCYRELHP